MTDIRRRKDRKVNMRVGVLTAHFSPEEGGGYTFENEIYQALVEAADSNEHKFTVFVGDAETQQSGNVKLVRRSLKNRLFSRGYLRTVGIAGYARLWNGGYWAKNRYDRVFQENEVDIMWCLNPRVSYTEIPFLATVWDLEHILQPHFPEVSAKGEWDRRERHYRNTLRKASFVITGTDKCKNDIERYYLVPPERVRVLRFPTPRFSLHDIGHNAADSILAKYGLDKNYLFYPAQFWPHKNHVALLKAVRILREEHDLSFTVVLVGSDKGNKKYIQEQISAMGLDEQVRLLGFVTNEELVCLYKNAFALVFPTFFGPDNLPPLEAFALECPVIASEIPGAKEQLGDAVLWVDPRNAGQLALAIKWLSERPALRNELIERGKTRASDWTGRDYVNGVLKMLDEFEDVRQCWK